MNKFSSGRRNTIEVFSGALAASHCAVNDHVRISIPEKVILQGSLLVYMLPLLAMLLGAALAATSGQGSQDVQAIAGAIGGFAIGVALVRWHAWHNRSNVSVQPRLVEIVSHSADVIAVA